MEAAKQGLAGRTGLGLTRIIFVVIAAFALGLSAFAGAPEVKSGGKAGKAKDNARMNVLFIALDDLRPDLGAYGHPSAVSPNIDRFAASGLLFERAYVSQAVCAPSRAALMTGLRPSTTGITTLEQPLEKFAPDAVSFAKVFKQAGYETVNIGKIYHHHEDDAAAWSKPNFDVVKKLRAARRKAGENLAYKREDDPENMVDTQHLVQAVKELDRLAKGGKPFLLAFGIHSPHLPFYAPAEAWDLYKPTDVPEPVSRKPQEGAPEYALVSYEVKAFQNVKDKLVKGEIPEDVADEMRHGYLASVSYADTVVGQMLDRLKALGLENDTIVILWSDHGYKLGDYNAWAKHSNADIDIHIPMMIRVPGKTKAGSRSKAIVETVDIYPTLMELAGLQGPQNIEGLSMVPLMSKPDRPWKQAAFAQFDRGKEKGGKFGRTVRTERYRYTAWLNPKTGAVIAQELYDHQTDPHELKNVAADPAYKKALADHEALRKAGPDAVRKAVKTK